MTLHELANSWMARQESLASSSGGHDSPDDRFKDLLTAYMVRTWHCNAVLTWPIMYAYKYARMLKYVCVLRIKTAGELWHEILSMNAHHLHLFAPPLGGIRGITGWRRRKWFHDDDGDGDAVMT